MFQALKLFSKQLQLDILVTFSCNKNTLVVSLLQTLSTIIVV